MNLPTALDRILIIYECRWRAIAQLSAFILTLDIFTYLSNLEIPFTCINSKFIALNLGLLSLRNIYLQFWFLSPSEGGFIRAKQY
ncbi:MAG: hypothetical protein KME22_08655 [Hassallia sp. WJT32-NPBG1]|nr:hypothetical protein [Hassallia sp. WJT32-NPBG1]